MEDKITLLETEVAPDTLIGHPLNSNVMDAEMRAKVWESIKTQGGFYPRIVVRSLELSEELKAEHKNGLLQILDGHHRHLLLEENGEKRRRIVVLGGVDDRHARKMVAAFNKHGEEDGKRREVLIRKIIDDERTRTDSVQAAIAAAAKYLPESAENIERYVQTARDAAARVVGGMTRGPTDTVKFTVIATPEMAQTIRDAINTWIAANDPDRSRPCLEAHALAEMVREAGGE